MVPFKFDILAQLGDIPTHIIMHKLLCLFKETKDALREALDDSESCLAQLPYYREEEY